MIYDYKAMRWIFLQDLLPRQVQMSNKGYEQWSRYIFTFSLRNFFER